jgi:mono/diheme cytochrome c family protein
LRAVLFISVALFLLAGCTIPDSQPLEKAHSPQVTKGKALYLVSCSACHQPNGRGLEGIAPPLAGTKWPNESEDRLVRIVLHGLRGPITVAGKEYNLEMPAMGFFDDQEIAAILTYIRAVWGKSFSPVTLEAIGKVRNQTRERSDSWTIEELSQTP